MHSLVDRNKIISNLGLSILEDTDKLEHSHECCFSNAADNENQTKDADLNCNRMV